jgi:hypothetical protein
MRWARLGLANNLVSRPLKRFAVYRTSILKIRGNSSVSQFQGPHLSFWNPSHTQGAGHKNSPRISKKIVVGFGGNECCSKNALMLCLRAFSENASHNNCPLNAFIHANFGMLVFPRSNANDMHTFSNPYTYTLNLAMISYFPETVREQYELTCLLESRSLSRELKMVNRE